MTADQVAKNRTVKAINKALKGFTQESYVEPSAQAVKFGRYDELSRQQLDQGVVALVLATNLSGGSVADMDLYKLLRTYLWSDEARAEINATVALHGF